jgi:hypothetical protein
LEPDIKRGRGELHDGYFEEQQFSSLPYPQINHKKTLGNDEIKYFIG